MIFKGTHPARALHAALGYSGQKKTEQVMVALQITEGDHAGENIVFYGYFATDKQGKFTIKALRACGWQGDDLSDLSTIDGSKDVTIVVEHEEYPEGSGEYQARVKYINDGSGIGLGEAMPTDAAKAFGQRMRAMVLSANGGKTSTATKPANGQRKQQERHPNAPEGVDDPF